MIVESLLVASLALSPLPQSEKRRGHIKDLLGKSDLVVVAVGRSYRPIIDQIKYRQERERNPTLDPSRMDKYMLGVAYEMTTREVVYLKREKDEKKQVTCHEGDVIAVYTTGPLVDPRQFGKPVFMPGVEYLIFLKKIKFDPEEFRNAVEQSFEAPMKEWRVFPDTRLIYFTPVRDSFAFLQMGGVWNDFLIQTRTIVRELQEKEREERR